MRELKIRRISKNERKLAVVMYWVPEDLEFDAVNSGSDMYTIGWYCVDRSVRVETEHFLMKKHTFLFSTVEDPNYLEDAVEHEVRFGSRQKQVSVSIQFNAPKSWIEENLVLVQHPTIPCEMPEEPASWLDPMWDKDENDRPFPVFRPFTPYVRPPRPKPLTRWSALRK